jgi:hypothetical protein
MSCDRCGKADETSLCISSFEYLCPECWGDGEHVCGACEAALDCCGCEAGCVRCGLTSRGLDPQPPVEGEAA